jgi:histidine racemase
MVLNHAGFFVRLYRVESSENDVLTAIQNVGMIYSCLIVIVTITIKRGVAAAMREIEYVKCNPTQNMTILVKTAQRAEDYKRIASRIMSYDSVYAEQVGFIEQPASPKADASLQMAGGEFCGNACMALAVYLAAGRGRDIQPEDPVGIVLESSGTDQLVNCQVKRAEGEDAYRCRIAMPVPVGIETRVVTEEDVELELAIVRYRDFFHIVIEVDGFRQDNRRQAERIAKLLGIMPGTNVVGVMLFKPDTQEMAPLIYVPPVGSLIWERGCGSGTASLGAYLSWRDKRVVADMPVNQPGGKIHVSADWNPGGASSLVIEGNVGIVAQGTAFIRV